MNKYEQKPEIEIDLHGHTTLEAREVLQNLLTERNYKQVRIITGKGTRSENGFAVLRDFTKSFLHQHGISYRYAKLQDGGEGALEVSL